MITRALKNKKQQDIFTYLSLFSGVGGFEIGIQRAMPYAKCVGFSEIDPYAKSIYQRNFKNHKDYRDVTEINENELPEFDCLVAGFPCQPFSLSGKRQGFNDTRGTLFFDIVRILKAKHPKVFVLENVRGLLSHDEGRTFGVIIKTLDELRYDVQWQVLNCKHHGTPQDRNRVFIVGYSRAYNQSGKKILPIRYSGSKVAELSGQQTVTNTIKKSWADGFREGSYIVEGRKLKIIGNIHPSGVGMNGNVYSSTALAPTLTTNKGEGLKIFHSERVFTAKGSNEIGGSLGLLSRNDGICYALTKKHANHIVQLTESGLTQGARVYDPCGIGITLNSKGGGMGANTGLYLIKNRVRRLMPIEGERLQDIPDEHTKFGKNNEVISDAQRYACIGNAVNSKVVKVIFDKLRDVLIDKKAEEKILIPRVVSFSGGRTSAMMLLQLLEKDELKQWRGDCVVFNNTSAEHSATYAFVSRIKKITEEKYNIPFFMTEFCTYEAKTNRGYVRRITYKLINDLPYCEHNNIHGYKFQGEVFEESISQTGVLPSTYQRNCTINMKILTTNNFLTDWMASKTYINQQGEFSEISNISDADIVKKHRMYNGELSDAMIVDKKTFVRSCQAFRPKQFFKDFTNADINYNNTYLKEKITNGCISILGKDAIKYHNYIGIRFDEKHRAIKIRKRIKDAKKNLSRKGKNKISSAKTQPPFENANMPMIKARIDKQKVIEFWADPARSKYDLDLPYDGMLSNCIHCMLKGKSKNQLLSKQAQVIALDNTNTLTPNSIEWWAWIEKKYSRKVIKSDKNEYTNIGFFGASKEYVYQTWVDELEEINEEVLIKLSEEDSWNMDCNCTD
ncbi:DNA (cytosine-5-)-methyltransferase [bacterium endosymbiont of Bathymodiolus sp. 5 South]|uniref:DNA (cytosine-5-)-methyltransferase n=1 Tax=bacterium endosymbiont of Bathymodiolus sp. 5 South TaxID=1181670 RepID=UPI0010B9F937|nr:DNA (cytosine-5-)-methyltransferase [bacterium endosymbiont of Bathymodiolus sp. 5 South]SSC08408.1 DNA-cytosine methyltransferase [bacterium endosymbiont of Bathymodiolus sp. 5 South]